MRRIFDTKVTAWFLLIITVLYLVTGYGITQARIVTALTLGILNKALCFKIHENLGLPFLAFLLFHILRNVFPGKFVKGK